MTSIEWLDDLTVAVTGSVNPSTTDTMVFNLQTGQMIADYPDDNGGAVFSPDGRHVASVTGKPHWSAALDVEPELKLDNRRVYPVLGEQWDPISKPSWSANSQVVAVIFRNLNSERLALATCSVDGKCETHQFQNGRVASDERFRTWWNGDDYIASSSLGTWSKLRGNAGLLEVPSRVSPQRTQYPLNLVELIRAKGGQEADLWCSNCISNDEPRKTQP